MRQFGIALAVVAVQALTVVRGGSGQALGPGSRVRVTARGLGRRAGWLVLADSGGLSVTVDGSDEPTRVPLADVQKLEVSRLKEVSASPTWAVVLGYGVVAGGAWYGASGWGHHARPKGVLGGVLGAVAGAGVAGFALEPWFEMKKTVHRWEEVPVIALGVSFRF